MVEQLDNSSALLLHLAGELPAEERAELERRLAADPALAAQLDELHMAQSALEHAMSTLDAADPLPGEAAAVARITRAMRQHKVRPSLVAYRPATVHRSFWQRVPRWSYPLTAAAAIALVYVGWWTLKPINPPTIAFHNPHSNQTGSVTTTVEPVLASESDESMVLGLENNLRTPNRTQGKPLHELRLMEQQVADLSQGGSDPLQDLLANHPVLSENE